MLWRKQKESVTKNNVETTLREDSEGRPLWQAYGDKKESATQIAEREVRQSEGTTCTKVPKQEKTWRVRVTERCTVWLKHSNQELPLASMKYG